MLFPLVGDDHAPLRRVPNSAHAVLPGDRRTIEEGTQELPAGSARLDPLRHPSSPFPPVPPCRPLNAFHHGRGIHARVDPSRDEQRVVCTIRQLCERLELLVERFSGVDVDRVTYTVCIVAAGAGGEVGLSSKSAQNKRKKAFKRW